MLITKLEGKKEGWRCGWWIKRAVGYRIGKIQLSFQNMILIHFVMFVMLSYLISIPSLDTYYVFFLITKPSAVNFHKYI